MKDPNCTQCQEWEICPFHPTDEAPVRYAEPCESDDWGDPDDPNNPFAFPAEPTTEESMREWLASDPKLRLLGPDDPEVSSDLIYLDEATGGLVGVPMVRVTVTLPGQVHRVVVEGVISI